MKKSKTGKISSFAKESRKLDEESIEIDFDDIAVGFDLPVDIYWDEADNEKTLLISSGVYYSLEAEDVVRGSGIQKAFIAKSDKSLFEKYLQSVETNRLNSFSGRFTDPEEVKSHLNFMRDYHALDVSSLVAETTIPFDIFTQNQKEKISTLFFKNKTFGCAEKKVWLIKNLNCVIRISDLPVYKEYLHDYAKNSKDPTIKLSFVRENAKLIVGDLAKNPRSEKMVGDAKQSIANITESIIENPTGFYALMQINNYDYYTYTHSVNVSTMTLALAMAIGIDDKEQLADLGLGAMLHDIGKSMVASELINKPGKLTDSEFTKVRGHVMLGYEMLKSNKGIPKRSFYPLLEHHEKLSGKGYPNRLPAEKIHTEGRVSMIIDIYDALTTERSYKKAFTPFDALTLIARNENDFDKGIFKQLVSIISRQVS